MSLGNDTPIGTLTSPSIHMPTLPLDLVSEILCRLPVKFLIQLKCVYKSWKSLISDPKFAKKHLDVSKTYHHHLIVSCRDSLLWDSTISSIFSEASTTSRVPQLQLVPPEAINSRYGSGRCVSSCDGILLLAVEYQDYALLWNPSIRKFRILPPLLNPGARHGFDPHYTFGYDHFIDNYKVFVVTYKPLPFITNHFEVSDYARTPKREVSVYTLGTDSWRRIDYFPYDGLRGPGVFVSGTVNWLAYGASSRFHMIIVSLDLENESYRTLLMPDFEKIVYYPSTLGVLRDCLCFFANEGEFFDVWVMNDYGST